jgi:hypothetical protein
MATLGIQIERRANNLFLYYKYSFILLIKCKCIYSNFISTFILAAHISMDGT